MKSKIEKNTRPKQQLLNLICFLDGGKTRTFKVSLAFVKTCIVILVLLVCWATIGSALFIRNIVETNRVSTRLQSALDTIFEYQVKYDSVFEKVYPTERRVAHEKPKSEVQIQAQTKSTPNPTVQTQALAKAVNLLNAKHLNIRTTNQDHSLLTIESPTLVKDGNHLNLSIALRNRKGQSRAEGLLWAIAEWQDPEGKIFTTRAPEKTKGKSSPDSIEGNTFSIRQYKVKTLSFQIPDTASTLSKVEIWLADRNSNKSSFEIVVNP